MSNLKLALENTMDLQIAEYENGLGTHEFSHRFEKRMKKLIKSMDGEFLIFKNRGSRVPLRKAVQLAFLILILAVLAAAAYAFISWGSFKVRVYDIYSQVNVIDLSGAPLTLEERYEIGSDLTEYDHEVITETDSVVDICYTDLHDENKTFYFSQMTKEALGNERINTENALQMPTAIEVNGCVGLYVQMFMGAHLIIWDNGSYIIEVYGTKEFGINELISICDSVQKVE